MRYLAASMTMGVFILLLGACAILMPSGGDLSPRGHALDLMLRYEAVQIIAERAVLSPLISEDAKVAIQTASRVATDAVLAYDAAVGDCRLDAEGVVAPGCDSARALLPAATAALQGLIIIIQHHNLNEGG